MRTLMILIFVILSISIQAQTELNRIGQTPGGSGYHVNYDSISSRLFVGAGTSLWVYDMSNPNNPVIIGKRPFLGLITETILFDNNTLFVSATFDGVYAIDLSSPDLQIIDHKNVDGIVHRAAYDMALVGDTLLIPTSVSVARLKYTDGIGFTNILPEVGPNFLQGNAFCVAERNNYVAVGARGFFNGKVFIYNKTDLINSVAVWQDTTIIGINKIIFSDLNDSILYVCGGSSNAGITSHFVALKFDGTNLTLIDSYGINGIPVLAAANIQNMDIQNDTLYIATGCAEDSLKGFPLSYIPIIDATGLPVDTLKEINYINAGLWHFDVSLIKGTPYMATASEWLGVAINNVKSGIPLDTLMLLPTGGWTQKSKVRGDTLWVAHEGWGLAAYNIDSLMFSNGNMTNSKILHIYDQRGDAHQFVGDFEFLNDTLIALSSGTIYNIKPWMQGGQPDSLYHIYYSGEVHNININSTQRIIVGSFYSMSIINPFAPNSFSLETINTKNAIESITIVADTILYGSKNDTASSTSVYLVASIVENDLFIPIDSISAGTGQINSIAIENNIIAVGKSNSIQFYLWNNSHFTYIGSYDDLNMIEVDLELKNNYLYIADKKRGVIILDISDSYYPIVGEFEGRGTWTNLFGSVDIEIADNGNIFLSDFNAGVIIIEAFDTTLLSSQGKSISSVNQNINIYPNPTSSYITIEFENIENASWNILLINTNGQVILQKNHISNNKYNINTKSISKGIYLLQFSNKNGDVFSKRVIII